MVWNEVAVEQFHLFSGGGCLYSMVENSCIEEEDAGAPESSWEQQHIPFTH